MILEEKIEKMGKQVDRWVGETGMITPILRALQDACYNTARHLEENWQDEHHASYWSEAGHEIGRLTGQLEGLGI